MSDSQGETVLVTGPSGFVGAAVTLELIKHGYKVKGTVRSQSKAFAFNALHPTAAPSIEWVIVPDIAAPNALDAAAKGCDHILHVASPFHYASQDFDKDMLIPAREGTLNALRAASLEPRVKRVVVTSSIAAVIDPLAGDRAGYTYTEKDWNPMTWEQAKTIGDPGLAYVTSKKVAEQAAWDFMESEKPHFSLTTVCPPMIYGPPLQPVESMDKLNTSSQDIWMLMNGSTKEVPPTLLPVWTDVRDVAKIHVDSLSHPGTANQRYLAVAGHYSYSQIAHVLAEAFPNLAKEDRITPSKNEPPQPHFATDSSKAEKEFGLGWIGFETCVRETAEALLELEKRLKAA